MTSRNRKKRGMTRSAIGANPAWAALMLHIVRQVARTKRRFTSDDVFALARAIDVTHGTRDLRAFGPVMHLAAKLGYCRKARCAPVNSARPSLHASPRTVWQSKIAAKVSA